MKFNYILKESLRGFSSAKFSVAASVFTITLSLILFAVYLSLSINSSKLLKSIKEKVEIEAFLDDSITTDEINKLKDKIRTIGGIKSITYVSKEDAIKIFEEDFGKEMLEILDSNPLPPSLKINVYEEYKSLERINKITAQISELPKVQEIIFPEKNVEILDRNTSSFLFINLMILILISITSVILVSNTIRLVISSKRKDIETLGLLGASKFFIRAPFILEGFIQGLAGGFFAVGIIYLIFIYFDSITKDTDLQLDFLTYDNLIYLVLIGIFLGIFGSTISVGKFIKKK